MKTDSDSYNIIYYLLEKFVKDERFNIGVLVIVSGLLYISSGNVFSYIYGLLIESIEKNDYKNSMIIFKYMVFLSISILMFSYFTKIMQYTIVNKVVSWCKHELLKIILLTNNENMYSVNFTSFNTLINVISSCFHVLFNYFVTSLLPFFLFCIVIITFFLVKNVKFGVCFFVGNALLFRYYIYNWNDMLKRKMNQELNMYKNENHILEIFNNIDKVIYRGKVNDEIDFFKKKTNHVIHESNTFSRFTTYHIMVMNFMSYSIIIGSILYLVKLRFSNKINTVIFITFLTMLLLYRNNITQVINDTPSYLEFFGKLNNSIYIFNNMIGKYKNIKLSLDKKYPHQELSFDRIQFKNVYFKHKNTEKMVFENFNLDLDVDDNKIIGITGPSGRGKSSLIKLLLRLHDPDSGSITFDDIPIDIIDPNYIRTHITYISQNSKLFDRNILDNILYSCDISELDVCKYNLELILKNKKFKKLFNNNDDFLNIKSGFLGENLSGGQRQFINILSGLVNPSKILILDEPTNAVDYELKSQIIRIIKIFKYYKKSIIIISHDKDIFPLFDININL